MAISAQWYTRAVTLDCADGHVGDMYANEGDANGRGIDLSLFDGKEPANTTGMSVYLAWGHEAGGEGLTPFSAVDAAHGRWRVLYPTAMQRSGTVLARIMVYLNGNRAAISGSKNFRIFVDVDPVDGSAALSDNDFSVFQQAVIDLNTAKANADKSTKAANDAAKKATDAAAGANAAEKSAAKATTDANTAAKSAASRPTGHRRRRTTPTRRPRRRRRPRATPRRRPRTPQRPRSRRRARHRRRRARRATRTRRRATPCRSRTASRATERATARWPR